ncbi:MAG: polysaccharide deacetylase family protein [Lachnospiraceae bacterium]|nr:polysaccharide deacetylase family protein [Lachnospiraceae bacterium]
MSKKWWVWMIMLFFGGIGTFCWWSERTTTLYLARQQDGKMEEWIASNATAGKKYAYLTFDDGPSESTDEILDTLKEKNVKATFFVVGKEGKLSEERYKRIVEEGHTLGMHSYSHDYNTIYHSVSDFSADIKKLDEYLYGITGIHPNVFRFPGGSSNSIVADIKPYIQWIEDQGYEYYDWNALSGDALSFTMSPETLNENILKDVHGQSPVIILMHDLAEASHTVEALPDLIDLLREKGYEFCKISKTTETIHHVSIKEQNKY